MENDIISMFRESLEEERLNDRMKEYSISYIDKIEELHNILNDDERKMLDEMLNSGDEYNWVYLDYVIEQTFNFSMRLLKTIIRA